MSAVLDPRTADCFVFASCGYDPALGEARLGYRFDDGPELVERIVFPHAPWPPEASRQAAFQSALELLHLIAGISYYKAGFSPAIGVESTLVDEPLRRFLEALYVQGLGEYGYVNRLDVAGRIRFPPASGESSRRARELVLPERALIAMGGGKDSLVGLDLMRGAGVELLPCCVGRSDLIRKTVQTAGLPLLRIRRELAPELSAMNQAGAWNGHVPITAINSAILLCAAILYGFRYIVFSNERSSDEATLVGPDGSAINHQYSKSTAFEAAFREVIASEISPDLEYFSVLRPFSELGVVQRFSRLDAFHSVYSSCNRNFHIDGPRVEGRWCLDCPKCRFAALSLALFMSPAEVVAIMGGDLLDDSGQEEGFRELCRLGRDKPFECVGEAGESRAAMRQLESRDQWAGHVVVRSLAPELASVETPPMDKLLEPASRHFIPAPLAARLGLDGIANESG